jgi:hypothetical protein
MTAVAHNTEGKRVPGLLGNGDNRNTNGCIPVTSTGRGHHVKLHVAAPN